MMAQALCVSCVVRMDSYVALRVHKQLIASADGMLVLG